MTEPEHPSDARRETTRTLLLEVARRLFAEQGVEATTIRQIADAAGVTERTFYRYFDGKEGLVGEDALAWIDVLHQAIRERPAGESPYLAVRRAMAAMAARTGREFGGALLMFLDRPRARRMLPRSTTRPLVRLETSITEALLARDPEPLKAVAGADADPRFAAELVARLAGAALRSAAIRHRQMQEGGGDGSPGVASLLDQAFSLLSALTAAEPPANT